MLETLELQTTENSIAKKAMVSPRPGFAEIYLQLAVALAERSTCARLKVGTVITSTDFRKVLAVGYNGNATGLPNCCDRHEAGNCGCLHSEENAVINCDSPRFIEKYVFVTHLPCSACAKRLINLGNVKRVYFEKDYRSRDSLELFRAVGIEVRQISGGFALQHLGGESREVIL